MAAGFPTKTSFANGNTLPASDLNDITGSMNLLFPQTSTTMAWQSYTPSIANFVSGNGTTTAFYTQIGKIVLVRYRFVFGSTSTISGTPVISMPVTANSTIPQNGTASGGFAVGATYYGQMPIWVNTTQIALYAVSASGSYTVASGTVGIGLVANSIMDLTVTYEAA